jgi:hypothetical protein
MSDSALHSLNKSFVATQVISLYDFSLSISCFVSYVRRGLKRASWSTKSAKKAPHWQPRRKRN